MSTIPSIYAACLAAYNNGVLHGAWIEATQEVEEIKTAISEMLKTSPIENAEEYAIHDYDNFETAQISEYEGIEKVNELAIFIEENGLLGAELYNHFSDLEEAKSYLENHYNGCFESVTDYAREIIEQTTEIPENLQYYIDYEAIARDMQYSGDIFTIQTNEGIHIF